jgi:hypothetical protein
LISEGEKAMPNTKIATIDLSVVEDLKETIVETCDNQLFGGFRLATSFVVGNVLTLIFQKVV